MGNYIADRQQLNDMLTEYTLVMGEYISYTNAFVAIGGNEDVHLKADYEAAKLNRTAITNYWENMVEVDSEAATNFQQATDGFIALSTTIDSFKGDLGKGGANLGALDIEKLQSVMFKDDVLCARLMEKMLTEEGLTYAEREILYHYFQNEILTDEKVAEFEEIVELLQDGSEESQQVLQEKINQLLISEEALDLHMAELQAFLFMGNLTPDEFAEDEETKTRNKLLYAYLAVLTSSKDYVKEAMEKTGAKDLEDLNPTLVNFEVERSDAPRMHKIDIELRVGDKYTGEMKYYSYSPGGNFHQKDVNNYSYSPGNWSINNGFKNEELTIKVYNNPNVGTQIELDEASEHIKAYNSYNKHFLMEELPTLGASSASGKLSPILEGIFLGNRYIEGKINLEKKMDRSDFKTTVLQLKMEAMTVESHTKNQANYQLLPTEYTQGILDRWEEVSHLNPEIPFPEEDVRNQNWNEVSDFYTESQTEFAKYPEALIHYIEEDNLKGSLNTITTKTEEE